MSLFQTLNVQGPANRGQEIAKLAQGAAQNVMRRQKMRALLQTGAAAAAAGGLAGSAMAGGGVGGSGHMLRGSFSHPGSALGRAAISSQQLADMMRGSGQRGQVPGGFMNAGHGGGFDFGALPDGAPQHSPSVIQPDPPQTNTSGIRPDGTYIGDAAYSAQFPQDNPDSLGAMSGPPEPAGGTAPANNALIPLGNGQFYDPTTDSIHASPAGGNAVRPGAQV